MKFDINRVLCRGMRSESIAYQLSGIEFQVYNDESSAGHAARFCRRFTIFGYLLGQSESWWQSGRKTSSAKQRKAVNCCHKHGPQYIHLLADFYFKIHPTDQCKYCPQSRHHSYGRDHKRARAAATGNTATSRSKWRQSLHCTWFIHVSISSIDFESSMRSNSSCLNGYLGGQIREWPQLCKGNMQNMRNIIRECIQIKLIIQAPIMSNYFNYN